MRRGKRQIASLEPKKLGGKILLLSARSAIPCVLRRRTWAAFGQCSMLQCSRRVRSVEESPSIAPKSVRSPISRSSWSPILPTKPSSPSRRAYSMSCANHCNSRPRLRKSSASSVRRRASWSPYSRPCLRTQSASARPGSAQGTATTAICSTQRPCLTRHRLFPNFYNSVELFIRRREPPSIACCGRKVWCTVLMTQLNRCPAPRPNSAVPSRTSPYRYLEPISKSFEEDNEAGKLDKAKEIVGVVLPTNEDPALPLNPGEEALDEPAPHVAA